MRRTPIVRMSVWLLLLVALTVSWEARAQTGPSGTFSQTWGPKYQSRVTAADLVSRAEQEVSGERINGIMTLSGSDTLIRVRVWNIIANAAVAIDHTPPVAG